MTKLFEKALARSADLSDEMQDAIARAIFQIADAEKAELEDIDPEFLSDVLLGLAEAEAGIIATPEEVEVAFRSFG
jgi:predicted transcriptional regulator